MRENTAKNRDCKLPTFLLALAFKELGLDRASDIIFLKSNPAHPFVRVSIGGETFFGHFTKPDPKDASQISEFEFLGDERTKELKNFISRDRAVIFSADVQGMKAMDELFVEI